MDSSQAGNGLDDPLRRRHRPVDEAEANLSSMNDQLDHQVNGVEQHLQQEQIFLQPAHQPPVASTSRRERHSNLRRTSKSRASTAYAVIGTCYLLMGVFVHQRMNSYPVPKTSYNSWPHEFREETARRFLEQITSFGPRVSGSEAHVKAEQYILEVINEINASKVCHNNMEVSLQTVSGGLIVDFSSAGMGQFTSVYQNLKNIVVKVSPPQGANSSLLVNCHYDTVIDSPGAGDDAASCSVMLEILRAMSRSCVNIMHNIIFLFNGAEENMLQTSHGFITRHPWAPTVRAFVNLDSAGAGGWEIVFQTGPGNPWLIKAYIEAAPHPHASVLGQEIFQTGVIPADTDFRIFRDYGKIPGIDVAHIKNGYVYHSRNDLPQFIPAGCMQRGGENMMATIILLASSSKLTNPGEDKLGSMVFFDFLGFFMVAYPTRMATILNWTTALYVYMAFVKSVLRNGVTGAGSILKPMLKALVAVALTWMITLLVPMAMSWILISLGHSLSYYTYNLNVIWLFIMPSVTAALSFHLCLKKTIFKDTDSTLMVVMLRESNLMLWSVVLVLLTASEVMSAFMPLMFILFPSCLYAVMEICGFRPTSLMFNLVASFLPSLYVVYMSYTLLMFIIPILGRTGMEASPDVIVAVLCGLPVMVCLPYQIGFVYTHSRVGRVLTTTLAVILLGVTSVLLTPAGFPYSGNPRDPSPQRAVFVHFDRRFYSHEGLLVKQDASIWYKPIDYNGGNLMEIYAPEVFARGRRATCDGVYCGRPYLYPILSQVDARKTYDFPASHLQVPRVTIEHHNRTLVSDSEVTLAFKISGPSHVTIFISGFPLVRVKNWTCGQEFPVEVFTVPYIKYPTYFIYYSHGWSDNTTWEFSINVEVEGNKNINSSLIRIGFAGHYLHGPYQVTPDLLALEEELPLWMLPGRWSATYDEYIF
ncbi:hypothetical protein BsWGS_20044 [Bradybaena similaris]